MVRTCPSKLLSILSFFALFQLTTKFVNSSKLPLYNEGGGLGVLVHAVFERKRPVYKIIFVACSCGKLDISSTYLAPAVRDGCLDSR